MDQATVKYKLRDAIRRAERQLPPADDQVEVLAAALRTIEEMEAGREREAWAP